MNNKLFDTVKEGELVIDCGAYLGKISNYFADKGAIVYAFEPCRALAEELETKFQQYKED